MKTYESTNTLVKEKNRQNVTILEQCVNHLTIVEVSIKNSIEKSYSYYNFFNKYAALKGGHNPSTMHLISQFHMQSNYLSIKIARVVSQDRKNYFSVKSQ